MTDMRPTISPTQRARQCGADRKRKRRALVRRQQGLCHWCGSCIHEDVGENHPKRATLDHIIPLAYGGSNDIANLVAACRACNKQRAIDQVAR